MIDIEDETAQVADGAIEDFEVVCDRTNNADDDIARGYLNVTIKAPLGSDLHRRMMQEVEEGRAYIDEEGIFQTAPAPEPSFFWLSFCDSDRPEGEQFLGATTVAAATMEEALAKTWRLKINPGGECQGVGIIDDGTINPDHLAFMLNKLRSRAEIEERGIA